MNNQIDLRLQEAKAAIDDGDLQKYNECVLRLTSELQYSREPLLPLAQYLIKRADFQAADKIIQSVLLWQPTLWEAHETYIDSAHHRRDWSEALKRAQAAEVECPNNPRPFLRRALIHMIMADMQSAQEALIQANFKFPQQQEIALELARIPLALGDPLAAFERLTELFDRFPGNVRVVAAIAETLRLLGRFEEADAFLERLSKNFETEYHFAFQRAWNSVRLRRWEEAFERWTELLKRFPNDNETEMALGDTLSLWQLSIAEGDMRAVSAKLPSEIARRVVTNNGPSFEHQSDERETSNIMMQFESLGDNCEFGLVQRHFGAEPLSLLRWSSGIRPQQLADAIACRFNGVGESENTFLRLHTTSKEYFCGDRRFFQMHTFIKQNGEDEAKLFATICRRMSYLKEKLIADLDDGSKIFIYKPDGIEISDDEGEKIATLFRTTFPAARLVLVRAANNAEEISRCQPIHGNVIWGCVSRFAVNLDRQFIKYDEWYKLCLAVRDHFDFVGHT